MARAAQAGRAIPVSEPNYTRPHASPPQRPPTTQRTNLTGATTVATTSGPKLQGTSPERVGPSRRLAVRLTVVVVASLTAVIAVAGLGSAATTPTSEFIITARVMDLSTCKTGQVLYPGLARCLQYTVQNTDPKNQITVTSLRVASVTAPASCSKSNLDLSKSSWSGSVVIAKGKTAVVGNAEIMLANTMANQDGCKGVTFAMAYAGTAINAGTLPTPAPSATPTATPTPTPTATPTATPRPKPTKKP